MARTRSESVTRTFTRLDLLKGQVQILLRRGGVDERTTTKIARGISERWIKSIHLYGYDTDGKVHCCLSFHVDWDRHHAHLRAGRSTVSGTTDWKNEAAIELDVYVSLFREVIEAKSLEVETRLAWAPGIGLEIARRTLGFRPGPQRSWAGSADTLHATIVEADEVSLDLDIVTEET